MGSRNCFQTLNYEFSTVQQQRRESALGRYIVVILELKIRTSGNFSNGENGQLCFCTLFVAQTPTASNRLLEIYQSLQSDYTVEFVPSDDLHSLVLREDHNNLAPDCEWRGKESHLLDAWKERFQGHRGVLFLSWRNRALARG